MAEQATELKVWRLGVMALVKPMLDELGIAEIIDETCPTACQGDLSHGQVAEVLIGNRFTDPTALSRVQEWAEEWRTDLVLGIPPEKLYDNRLGRALDAMYPHLSTLKGKVAIQAIQRFGLDLTKIHHDATDIAFYGAYADQPAGSQAPKIVRGYSQNHRPDLKQLRLSLFTLNDGGVPLWPYAASGNGHAARFILPHLEEMRQHIQMRETVVIHDREAYSKDNVCALHRAGLGYVIGVPLKQGMKGKYPSARQMGERNIELVPYVSGRDAKKPPDQRARYYIWREMITLRDPQTGAHYRADRLYVRNTAKMHRQRQTRRRHIAKVRAELERIGGLLNRYDYTVENQATVRKRIRRVLRRSGGKYFSVALQVVEQGRGAQLQMDIAYHPRLVAEDGRFDGLSILETNLLTKGHTLLDVLKDYKDQYHVEFSFRDLKGPFAVAPVFLHTPERIEVLIFLIVIALMIYTLIARNIRLALGDEPFLDWPRVTARRIVDAFRSLSIVGMRIGHAWHYQLTTLTEAQRQLLALLRFPEPASYLKGLAPP